MNLKDSSQYRQLKEAMGLLHELKIPEHLQEKALQHLLSGSPDQHAPEISLDHAHHAQATGSGNTKGLRDFVKKYNPKGAVTEIPTLLYWAKSNEGKDIADEKDILTLFRRSDIRPPKNIAQSLRDLSSKRYGRLEPVKDKPGFVKLSRVGEDFVIYDVIGDEADDKG